MATRRCGGLPVSQGLAHRDPLDSRDPFQVFDWYWADGSSESARSDALRSQPAETECLMEMISADSLLHFALWAVLGDSHPVGGLWSETQTDLQATIYLAYGGFFRQALTVLRTWFELVVHAVYFSDHYGQPTGRYEKWRIGDRNAPAKMEAIAVSLSGRRGKQLNVDADAILGELQPIYSVLCDQAHGSGLDKYKLQDGRDNVTRYLEKSFNLWFESLLKCLNAGCFLYRAFFRGELAEYFSRYKSEAARLGAVADKLSPKVPHLGKLVEELLQEASKPVRP